MYSIVLMMALSTTATDSPSFGRNGCDGGCYGGGMACYGGGGCYGGGYGCNGGGCRGGKHGGGGLLGGGGGLFHGRRGGCNGGCSGSSCHGYGGGCSGYGGCTGYGGGCSGYGGGFGGCTGYGGGYGGCTGFGGGCWGGQPVGPPVIVDPKKDGEKGTGGDKAAAPATIVVSLPAEAKLTVDDQATTSTSATRTFASPALQRGMDYHYTLKAEVVRDGKTVTETKRVAVRAGERTEVNFTFPVASVASK